MFTWLGAKLKQIFCLHRNTYFKEATGLERKHDLYGKVICCRCGKCVHQIVLFDYKKNQKGWPK